MDDIVKIENLIRQAEQRLSDIESERKSLCGEIESLKKRKDELAERRISSPVAEKPVITKRSSLEEKTSLFRQLFRGREDVYACRWESTKTGKSGYQPACEHEWVAGICRKPSVKCSDCPGRSFHPLTDSTIGSIWRAYLSHPAEFPASTPSAFILSWPMQPVVSWLLISTRRLDAGCRSLHGYLYCTEYICGTRTISIGKRRAHLDILLRAHSGDFSQAIGFLSDHGNYGKAPRYRPQLLRSPLSKSGHCASWWLR